MLQSWAVVNVAAVSGSNGAGWGAGVGADVGTGGVLVCMWVACRLVSLSRLSSWSWFSLVLVVVVARAWQGSRLILSVVPCLSDNKDK